MKPQIINPADYFSRIFYYHPKTLSHFKPPQELYKPIRRLRKALSIKLRDYLALCSISLPNFTEQYPYFMVWDRDPIEDSLMWQFETLTEAYEKADQFPIDPEDKIFLIAQWETREWIEFAIRRG